MGVSLSEALSSAGFNGWETVFDVDSSIIEGASRGEDSVSTRVGLI